MRLLFVALLLCFVVSCTGPWEVVKIGEVQSVQYMNDLLTKKTAIQFTDGVIIVMFGHHNIPSRYICIEGRENEWANGKVEYRILDYKEQK